MTVENARTTAPFFLQADSMSCSDDRRNLKKNGRTRECYVRPNGADRQWVEVPPR